MVDKRTADTPMREASGGSGRPGRRPGDTQTRDAILVAARGEFAARGYDRATIRSIAAGAQVDPALVIYFFDSKPKLFLASIESAVDAVDSIPAILEGPPQELGERLVRFYLNLWEAPQTREAMQGMVRSALSHEEAAQLLHGFLQEQIFSRLAKGVEGRDAHLRVEIAGAHLVGLGVARYLVRVEPLASAPLDEVVAIVAPALQEYLDAAPRKLRRPTGKTGD